MLRPAERIAAESAVPELIHGLAQGMVEQRAKLADRAMYDQLLVQMLLSYAQAERELRDLNELKNRFLGMAAHDLRNPLSALRGMAQLMLEMDMDAAQRREFLQEMHKTADDMLRLVNDLLDVAVIESGKLEVRLCETDFSDLVRSRIKLLAPVAAQKGSAISAAIAEGVRGMLDPDRCSQVVDNLLSNAIKFSPPGSTIHVTAEPAEGELLFAVRDAGPGVSEEDRLKIFGAFQKLDARPTGGEKSTGLGLAIVKKIVDAHRGEIDIINHPSRGAEFRVRLPKEAQR